MQIVSAFDRQSGQLVTVEDVVREDADGPEMADAGVGPHGDPVEVDPPGFIPILEVESSNGWLRIVTPVVEDVASGVSTGSNGQRMAPRERPRP